MEIDSSQGCVSFLGPAGRRPLFIKTWKTDLATAKLVRKDWRGTVKEGYVSSDVTQKKALRLDS